MDKKEILKKLGINNIITLENLINRLIEATLENENKEFTIKIANNKILDTVRESSIEKLKKSKIDFIRNSNI